MKYPISKNDLENYNIDNISHDRMNHTFHGSLACHDFHTHLYHPSKCNSTKEYSFDGDIQMVVEEICYDFPQHLYYTFYSKKYIFIPVYIAISKIKVLDESIGTNEKKKIIMEAVINKLKLLFIDCSIATDKTNSYIYIQW
jgi:hypothetical protein